jgi:predicted RND superfamily exporter protein
MTAKMEHPIFHRFAEFVLRYRRWVIASIVGMTVVLTIMIGTLRIDMDPDIWAPQSHPYVKTTHELERIFGGRNFTIIGIAPTQGDIYQPEILAKIKRIQIGIEQLPEAIPRNVISIAARKAKDIRGTPSGMEARPFLETIPQTPAEIARLQAAVAANPIYINSLVSPDGKAAAIVADFNVNKENPSYATLFASIQKIVEPERDPGVAIYYGGLPVNLAGIEHYMMQMPIYFGLAFLIIIAIQYWSFRTIQGMFLPVVTALLSVLWALGLMGVFGVHMDAMNTNTPILIMAVAAGHAIQILKRYYEELANQRHRAGAQQLTHAQSEAAVVESLARVGPVMLTAGAIAALTFFSLITSEISVVRHFGVFAGSGILSALVLEMTFIPAVRSLLPVPTPKESERERRHDLLDRWLSGLANWLAAGRAIWIFTAGVVLAAVALLGLVTLKTDNSFTKYFDEQSMVRVEDAALNAKFGGTNSVLLLVKGVGSDSIKDPKLLQAIADLQTFLDGQPSVGKTQSIADFVKRMNMAMHGDSEKFNSIPNDQRLIAQYLLLYSLSGDPQDFDNLVDNDYQKAVIWVYVKEDSTAYAQSLFDKTQAFMASRLPPGASISMGGSLPQTIAINDVVIHGKIENIAQMALVVFLLSSLALRSFVGGLFVTTPLVLIVLANFGIMGWLGVPLDMGTATTASMAIGIGADYEIYLLFRLREELRRRGDLSAAMRETLLTSGKAVLFVAFSVAGGYATLLIADFGFYTRLALMVVTTMLVSALSAVLFLRSTIMLFEPRFIYRSVPQRSAPAADTAQ